VREPAQERQRGARDHDELALGRDRRGVALEIGADDYVVKRYGCVSWPHGSRRTSKEPGWNRSSDTRNRAGVRDWSSTSTSGGIYRAGQEVELTHTEFDLLTFSPARGVRC